jgi:predicted HAD superfamily Cof-like phosphohydrolase
VPSNFVQVGAFLAKFDLPNALGECKPHLIPEDVIKFRLKFLEEELNELAGAFSAGDLPNAADALIDLVYVALGTAHLMGLPWEALFAEVQRVNMMKQRAQSVEESKAGTGRGHSFDVIKPPGWTPPDIEGVLRRFGWKPDG